MIYCDSTSGDVLAWNEVVARASAAHPNTTVSISRSSNAQALAVYNVDIVQEVAPPEVQQWQTAEAGPITQVEGVWSTTWVISGPTVAEAVEVRKAAIERERDALRNVTDATVTLDDGRVFQTDPVSRDLMDSAKSTAELNGGEFAQGSIWRGADNVNYPRTWGLFAEISAKEEARQQPIWYMSWLLKEEIHSIADNELLTDDEKVAAIMSQTWAMPSAE